VVGRIEDSSDIPVNLWKVAGLRSVVSSRVITVGDIASQDMTECASFAQQSALAVEKVTKIHPQRKYLVLLPRTNAEFAKWTLGTSSDDDGMYVAPQSSGAAGWIAIDTGESIGSGATVLDNPSFLEHVVRHEFFHANTLPEIDSVGNAPKWVIEGFAEWFASSADVVFPQHAPPAVLPTKDHEFAHDTKTHAYARSFMFISYLVARFGQAAAIRFYKRALEPAYGTTAASFAHVFGHSLASVEHAWAQQYRKQVAGLTVDVYEA